MKHMATDVFGPQSGEAHQAMLDGSNRQFLEMAEGTQSKEPRGLTVSDIVVS